jgi:radical SAM protein with 4Fe4S-binding SPASM domain
MHVILTGNPSDTGERPLSSHDDCACDCQCACPTDGVPMPVLSLPAAYYLELTPGCHNRCPGCGNVYAAERGSPRGTSRLPRPLNGDEWRALIARLATHAQAFKLTGGEPTLHPALARIVGAIDAAGVPFTLFTNGRWTQPEALIRLLRGTATCEGLLISLHGPDPVAHEAFSGVPGSFEETAVNLRRATAAGLEVATSMVIHRRNWERVGETLDLALRLGANHVVCNRLIGPPLDGLSPSQQQLRAAVATIEALRRAGRPIRFGNCIPQCFAPSSARGCTAGSTFATIDPWGRMRPCNHAPLVAGDLRTQAVQEAWNDPAMAHWRSLVPSDCARCPAFATCHGGCRAQALLTGQAQDPLIQAPLVEAANANPAALRLYGGLRPVGRFVVRPEEKVPVLLRKGQAAPVPAGYERLVSQLDGSLTLRQLATLHGTTALDWVGALYQHDMVTWV